MISRDVTVRLLNGQGLYETSGSARIDLRVGCIQPTTWLDGLREQPPPCLSNHDHLVRVAVHPALNDGATRSRWLRRQVIEQTAEAIFGRTPTEYFAGPVVELGGDCIEMLATVRCQALGESSKSAGPGTI
ncbi:hypothetical protein H351_29575 [Rhodococcus erythropolis R138]|nr:hypothetical protein H351_29575 [Rhodococcus erythropolis R138]